MRRTLPLATLLVLSLGTFAACGGDDDEASGTPEDTGTTQGETESTEGTEGTEGTESTEAPEGENGGGGGSTVTVVGEDIEWTEDDYTATAGEVSFVLQNNDSIRHTLVIDGIDEETFKLEADGDGTDEGSAELEAGDYEIFCDVPGHASMRATLTVE